MTRPRKDVVDYIQHYLARGKTIPTLEKKYGNDGYAFWWKTLEILGMSEGHYFDCNNPVNWEYLQTYTLVSEDIANEILDLLAKLDAIDKGLWQNRVIWSENFIANLSSLYARRLQKPPVREVIVNILSLPSELLHTENPVTEVIDDINPQSIVEYSIYIPPKKKSSSKKPELVPLPEDFNISDEIREYCKKNGHVNVESHFEAFKDRAIAKDYRYAGLRGWNAAFKTAIRENWGKINFDNGGGNYKSNRVSAPKDDPYVLQPGHKYKCEKCKDTGFIFNETSGPQECPCGKLKNWGRPGTPTML